MTDEEMNRFQKYVRRLQLANGIVTVLKREEREDMAVLLRKCQGQLQQMENAIVSGRQEFLIPRIFDYGI